MRMTALLGDRPAPFDAVGSLSCLRRVPMFS